MINALVPCWGQHPNNRPKKRSSPVEVTLSDGLKGGSPVEVRRCPATVKFGRMVM